jgi:hypothetical protein
MTSTHREKINLKGEVKMNPRFLCDLSIGLKIIGIPRGIKKK